MNQIPKESEDRAFADRLLNYSDAIVALAFIVSSGLGLAIADPDTRGTIADVAIGMTIGNIILGGVFSTFLVILRRWEWDLREGAALTDKYRKYSRGIYIARHGVIWLSVTQTVTTMLLLGV